MTLSKTACAFIALSAGFAMMAAPANAMPPNKNVTVDNAADNPVNVRTVARKIPVMCDEVVGLDANDGEVDPTCRRVDTGALVFPVPNGMTFALTDVLMNRNALVAPGGTFFFSARSNGSSSRFDWSGDPALSPSKHFVTPMVFVGAGDSLIVRNGDISAAGSKVDVFMSGYLIETSNLGY